MQCAGWVKYCPEFSVDLILSDFLGTCLGYPGLGDKMLKSAFDYGMPLMVISASSPESLAGSIRSERITLGEFEYHTMYDSIMDSCNELQKTANCTSVFSLDSTFFGKNFEGHNPRYCPISSFSTASEHDPVKENDTMISVSTSAIYWEMF